MSVRGGGTLARCRNYCPVKTLKHETACRERMLAFLGGNRVKRRRIGLRRAELRIDENRVEENGLTVSSTWEYT